MNEIRQQPVARIPWGSKYIQKLSEDLKEYGSGYSIRNLERMAKFSNEFSYEEIFEQVVRQIPWGTLITIIIPKSKSHEEMQKYNKGEII